MPIYKYSGQDAQGRTVRGKLNALDEAELYERLKSRDVTLLSSKKYEDPLMESKLPTLAVADFCQELSSMLKAGITLIRALNIMADEDDLKPKYKKIYENIIGQIYEGMSLSDAMEKQGRAFPELLINMVRSAEASGTLDTTTEKMGVFYEKQHRLKKKIDSSLLYPKLLITVAILAVVFIVTFVVPEFKPIFDTLPELPLPTAILLGASNFIKSSWILLVIIIAAAYVALRLVLKIDAVRYNLDKIKLRVPVFGKLLKKIYTARFANTLSSMYSSGLAITTALTICRDTVGNAYIAAQFDEAINLVRGGSTLSAAIASINGFERKLTSVVMIGEESGSLDEMLNVISVRLDYEAEMATESMVKIIEPVIIIFMALMILFIMVAVMLPIYNSYSSIEQSSYM